MKKKIQISPNRAQIIASLVIALVIGVFVFGVFTFSINQITTKIQEEHYKIYESIVESYAENLDYKFTNYIRMLDTYYVDYNCSTEEDTKKFLSALIPYREKTTPEIEDIIYITSDYKYFSQSEYEYNFNNEDFIKNIFNGNAIYDISSPFKNPTNEEPVIIISKGIKNQNGKITGIVCGVLPLNNLTDEFNDNRLSEHIFLSILDNKGRLIVDKDEQWLSKQIIDSPFVPTDATPEISPQKFQSILKGKDVYGNPTTFFHKKASIANWIIALGVPDSEINSIYLKQKKNLINASILSIFLIIILLIIEYRVLIFFQKQQIISTTYDPLTNLWTRPYFEKKAAKELRFYNKSKFMLVECDIRMFKFINQNYGEEVADKIIVYFSQLINKYAERVKGKIGRGFADRFYVFVKINTVREAMRIFKDYVDIINSDILDFEYPFFPKYGISFYLPEDKKNVTIQTLIGQASFSKNSIKDNAMLQYSIYNPRQGQKTSKENFIEQHMQAALDNNEFFVMYQPKIDLATEKVCGAEALVRWNIPDFGILNPADFIPLFEKNGFITKLDFFVYEQVFKFLQEQCSKGNPVVPISVNMSRNHDKPERFIHQFMNIFKKYNIPANLIQVEILERSFSDSSTLAEITNSLHKEGFTVAMDDFGKGESSLSMLTQIPVDILKFDKEFLDSSTLESGDIDSKSAGFIQILISLSKHLNKETVFEGVETEGQKNFLKSVNCDQAQGFFYSKPLVQDDFESYTKSHI